MKIRIKLYSHASGVKMTLNKLDMKVNQGKIIILKFRLMNAHLIKNIYEHEHFGSTQQSLSSTLKTPC